MALPNLPVGWLGFIRNQEIPSLKFGAETKFLSFINHPVIQGYITSVAEKILVNKGRSKNNRIGLELETDKET